MTRRADRNATCFEAFCIQKCSEASRYLSVLSAMALALSDVQALVGTSGGAMSTNSNSNPQDNSSEPRPTGHTRRLCRDRGVGRRVRVRQVSQGQFREVLAKLEESEADMLRFKWGLQDGQAHSASITAEKFSVNIEVVSALEIKALDMVSDL